MEYLLWTILIRNKRKLQGQNQRGKTRTNKIILNSKGFLKINGENRNLHLIVEDLDITKDMFRRRKKCKKDKKESRY